MTRGRIVLEEDDSLSLIPFLHNRVQFAALQRKSPAPRV